MLPRLTRYPTPPSVASPLCKHPTAAMPLLDDLVALQQQLAAAQERSLERARKAEDDLRTIQESIRRMKQREKGKAKAIENVKRERDFTPVLDHDEPRATSLQAAPPIQRHDSVPVVATPRSALDARRLGDDIKKKHKRKRDDDSEAEHDALRPRKGSLPPQYTHPHTTPKATKLANIVPHPHVKSPAGPEFSVPPPVSLLPSRPPIAAPPIPGPSKSLDVHDDFSKLKPTGQPVPVGTFYASIEPWLRGVREEDVGFLEWRLDEVEPFVMPKLGRHYLDAWEEEHTKLYGASLPGFPSGRTGGGAGGSSSKEHVSTVAPQPNWESATLAEPDLLTEEKGHGPLTERLISALLPMPDMTVWKGVKAAEDAMEGRPSGSASAAAKKEKMNVGDLEERIRDTMKFHGLLDAMPDYTAKVDDPIATALRHAQQELRTVMATNNARKARLLAVARDRMAYQEYVELRDSLDKNIVSMYTKLQKKDLPKANKKKKHKTDGTGKTNGRDANGLAAPLPNPASLGFGPDEEHKLVVNDALYQLTKTRREWVDLVGDAFAERNRETPGRIWGIPQESVYGGIEEDIEREMQKSSITPRNPDVRLDVPRRTGAKGKEKAIEDIS